MVKNLKRTEEAAELIKPARDELIRKAAQGEVLHNDDTSMKVLSLKRAITEEAGERTGIFTSEWCRQPKDARLRCSLLVANMRERTWPMC